MADEVATLRAEVERLKAELAATAQKVPKKREQIAEMSSEVSHTSVARCLVPKIAWG